MSFSQEQGYFRGIIFFSFGWLHNVQVSLVFCEQESEQPTEQELVEPQRSKEPPSYDEIKKAV